MGEILTLRNRSTISATAGINAGAGNGGNVTIDAPLIFAFPRDNFIEANAFSGAGGNINITTRAIFGFPQFMDITASSNLGIDGNVNLNGRGDDLTRGAIDLPESPIDAEDIIANDICVVKDGKIAGGSSFTIIGKGGIAPNPAESIEDDRPIVEWSRRRSNRKTNRKLNNISPEKSPKVTEVKQAVGWWRKTDGTVVLTANPDEVRPLSIPVVHPSCQY